MSLQPFKKSFPYYIKIGMEYGSKKKIAQSQKNVLKKIIIIDDAVLTIDDILDNSTSRNNMPCLHRKIGIPKTIVKAELMKTRAISELINLMSISKTNIIYQKKVFEKINQFFESIYLGEKICQELTKSKKKTNQLTSFC